ncbi:MAG: signal peptidase I, partial [Ruminococcus sp.]|nr:signal peptidase I [Ruminococcus sp.]
IEQQKKEKERRETERAQRLKAERQYFESKPFEVIRREYSKNPIYAIPRLIRWILAMVFGIIPEDTDNPAFKAKRAELEEKKRQKEEARKQQEIMERYYRKYARTFKYRFLRSIDDRKFKKKRRQQMKGKPKPQYTPPQRTAEEQKAIDDRIKALYKEYHVGAVEKARRQIEERQRAFREWNKQRKLEQEQEQQRREAKKAAREAKKAEREEKRRVAVPIITEEPETETPVRRPRELRVDSHDLKMAKPTGVISGIISRVLGVITAILLAFVIYVMVCAAEGKPVKVFGKSLLMVVTGSMEPSIRTGDFIVIESVDTSKLEVGDVISFYSEQSDIKGMLVTHRITEVTDDGFITKGDANTVEDSIEVKSDKVAGKYVGKARFFIWLYSFTSPRKLLMLLVIIPVSAAAIYEVITVGRLTREAAELQYLTAEERHELAMREAIEEEKKRLRIMGYDPEKDDPDKPEEEPDEPEEVPEEVPEEPEVAPEEPEETPEEPEEVPEEVPEEPEVVPEEPEDVPEEPEVVPEEPEEVPEEVPEEPEVVPEEPKEAPRETAKKPQGNQGQPRGNKRKGKRKKRRSGR